MRSTILTVLGGIAVALFVGATVMLPGPAAAGNDGPITQFFGCGGLFGSDDGYEDNDTQGTASAVSLPFDDSDLISCTDDFDWYEFHLVEGGRVQIDATFVDASGDIDIALFTDGGAFLDQSISTTDNEKITYTAGSTGTYAVRVRTFSPPLFYKGNDYRLQITPSCPDDAFENDDTQGTATDVSIPFNETDLRSCPTDDDYFSFDLTKGGEVQVDATFIDADGDIDLTLFNSDGITVASAGSVSDNEKMTYAAPDTDVYTVRVHLFAATPDEGNQYELEIVTSCPDDSLEPNNSQGGSTPAGLPYANSDLRACPGDDDWFSFAVSVGEIITVDADFIDAKGDVNLQLYDPGGALVDSSVTFTDDEHVSYVAETSGFYAVRAYMPGLTPHEGNQYDLTITASPPAATATPTASPTPTVTSTPQATLTATPTATLAVALGDVNCDGLVNAIDALFVLQFIAGLLPAFPCPDAADVDGSGAVTAIDAALILQAAAGLITL